MQFKCKNCNKPIEIDFYYSTLEHKGKISQMWEDAATRATDECDCNKNKNSKN